MPRCATEGARTCAGVGGARYHVKVVQPIPFDAVAEVRADRVGAVGVRSADGIFFCAFMNVCPEETHFFFPQVFLQSEARGDTSDTHHLISQQEAFKWLQVAEEHLKVPHLAKTSTSCVSILRTFFLQSGQKSPTSDDATPL